MSELLQGQALVWAIYDPPGVLTAAIQGILAELVESEPILPTMERVDDPREFLDVAQAFQPASPTQPTAGLGLAIANLGSAPELPAVCSAFQALRRIALPPICLAHVPSELSSCMPVLAEAGAQIVVRQLPSLQYAIEAILGKIPRGTQGYHPLTNALVERLPWPELDDAKNL